MMSKKSKPKALVFSGYGLNCEEETARAFETAGAQAQIIHINDLIANKKKLRRFQILALPGGFSFGDDTGSGNAFAWRVKNHLWGEIKRFLVGDRLVIGICNGCQILASLGVFGKVSLVHNQTARYVARWVDLQVASSSPWTLGLKRISLPIAHGEGRFYAAPGSLRHLQKEKMIAFKYLKGEMAAWQGLSANPTGTLVGIAGLTDKAGKILGIMPHPERAVRFTQLPNWTYLREKYLRQGQKLPQDGPGLALFKNAVNYFQ